MLIQIFLALTIGILAGTITGLLPGIHINLIGAMLISLSPFLLQTTSPITLVIFIVAMSITHTFIDFIPSIFLGAPEEGTALSVLPGHELLKQGKGYEAITLTAYGSLSAIFIILLISPFFIIILPKIETTIRLLIPFLLIAASTFLILKENKKLQALITFTLAGFLGIAVLNSNINQPFLPLLSGLFGTSSLIISIKNRTKIPEQKISKIKPKLKSLIKPVLASTFSAPLCSFLPGIGSGQAAVIGTSFIKSTKRNFLILLGATNTLVIGLSFIVFYSIQRKRTGVIVTLENILNQITFNHLIIIILTITLTGIIAFYLTIQIAKLSAKSIDKINYTLLSTTILIIIMTITLIFSGFQGIYILIISTATGIYGVLSGIKRVHLMGALVLPVTLFYLI